MKQLYRGDTVERERIMGIKRDCLIYDRNMEKCTGLMVLVCAKGKCPFYKNQQMLDEQVERIRKRIPDYDPKKPRF